MGYIIACIYDILTKIKCLIIIKYPRDYRGHLIIIYILGVPECTRFINILSHNGNINEHTVAYPILHNFK